VPEEFREFWLCDVLEMGLDEVRALTVYDEACLVGRAQGRGLALWAHEHPRE